MPKPKLIRITTVPLSLEKLLEGQLAYMKAYFEVVAISSEKERLEAYGKKEGVRVFPLALTRKITPIADIKAVHRLYRFLKREKPTIVHTHTPKAGIVGMMAAWLAGVPHRLHTVAGLPLMEATGGKRILLDFIEKLTYRCATKVYPNSKGLHDFILAEKLAKPTKLSIIGQGSSNGIDTAYFDPSLYTEGEKNYMREELGIPQNHFTFVFVGRLVTDKGINELVAAFGKLGALQRNISLVLVGPFEDHLDPLAPDTVKAIKTHPNIHAVGYKEDVRPYLVASDALAFPSYREGFPNVVMQAGSMGLPAIATDINGCNEIITQGKNGLLIPPKNETALLEAMKNLATDPNLHAKLKATARQTIAENYGRKEIWEALLREYRRLETSE